MMDRPLTAAPEAAGQMPPFDATKPNIARVYDYWLGGKDNYAADRAEAERLLRIRPRLRRRSARRALQRALWGSFERDGLTVGHEPESPPPIRTAEWPTSTVTRSWFAMPAPCCPLARA